MRDLYTSKNYDNFPPPLRVMMLHAPTSMAGAEGVILNINKFMANSREIQIINCPFINFSRGYSPYLQELNSIGIKYEAIPLNRRFEYRYIKKVKQLITKHRIDLIHSHGYRSDITALLAANKKIPVVSTIHGFTANSSRVRIYEFLQKMVLKRMSLLMPVSIAIERQLIKMKVPKYRIRRMTNTVACDTIAGLSPSTIFSTFGIDENTAKIVFVGRVSVEKGVDVLIKACRYIKKRGVPFFLLIVGDGPFRAECERLVQTNRLGSEIKFVGYRRDAVQIAAAANIFVLPSRTEGIPLVALEAMALGLPIIATNVGGLPELIKNKYNGVLIESENAEELANALELVIPNKRLANQLGANAKNTVRNNFNPDHWAADLLDNYYLAVGRRNV